MNETQNVVHLVRIVGSAGRHDRVGSSRARGLIRDLRIGIRHREHDRVPRHRPQHLRGQDARHRDPDEDVRIAHGVRERARGRVGGKAALCGFIFSVRPLYTTPTVSTSTRCSGPDSETHIHVGAGDPGRAGARKHHADLIDALAGQLQRVEKRGAGDDGGAVLIVVEHGICSSLRRRSSM